MGWNKYFNLLNFFFILLVIINRRIDKIEIVMVYDLNMLKSFYVFYKGKMEYVCVVLKCFLMLVEKILYIYLYNVVDLKNYERGEDYVNFCLDCVVM